MVLPLLFFIIFAIIEGSFLVFSLETANYGAQAAVDALAQAGQSPTADTQALLVIRNAIGQTHLAVVDQIDIEDVSAGGSPLGFSNHYRLDGTAIGKLGWPPASRNVEECCADFVKVTIRLTYQYRSGLLGRAPGLTATAMGRLEPRVLTPGRIISGALPAPLPVHGSPGPRPSACSTTAPVWTELHPATSPPARFHSQMSYDSGRLVDVLFGGDTQSGVARDTWEWNGADWTLRTPAVSPSARHDAAMAYDPLRGRVILFGGEAEVTPGKLDLSAETWSWDGVNWTRLRPATAPVARAGARMIWNPDRARLVLFGGIGPPGTDLGADSTGDPGVTRQYLGDSWEFDGSNWTRRTGGPRPNPRLRFAYTFDPILGAEVLYGGQGYYKPEAKPQDTWLFRSGTWSLAVPQTGTHPTAHLDTSTAFVPSLGATINIGGTAPSFAVLNETWQYDAAGWTRLRPTSSPPAMSAGEGAADPRGGMLILVALAATSAPWTGQTWELSKGCSTVPVP